MTDQPAAPTPGPWEWSIHDHSMATLHGPDMMRDHVLAVGPCRACIERVKDGEWKWGRCTTPTETNAKLLAASWATAAERDRLVVVHEGLVKALERIPLSAESCHGNGGRHFCPHCDRRADNPCAIRHMTGCYVPAVRAALYKARK